MSRKLVVVFLVMLVLTGAMGLKTAVMAHSDGSLIMANGSSPAPITPYRNGSSPAPITPYRNGSSPAPITPY
ncbi:MAG TPA: hypothetical protein VN087_07105 [Verrucomicrobiae bacterium]|jgi:hypothetical protein|nr:hypothetical protein [Verrucomicrobiae bacterium]